MHHNPSLTTFLNPYSYLILRRTGSLEEIFSTFNIEYDGISLVALHNLTHSTNKRRKSFDDTSLAPQVFETAARDNLKVGILGSAPDIIEKAKSLINAKYGHTISQSHSGYFEPAQQQDVLEKFMSCDIVICSMGTPKQEETLIALRNSGWTGSGFTCGGYFDQLCHAGGGHYYPSAINKLNLRWLYRIYKEPRRLFPRYFFYYPLGLALFFIDNLCRRIP